MATFVALLRGINVGGKNKVSMADLRECLGRIGFTRVSTYLASGNVILESSARASGTRARIEKALPENFELDSELVRVLVLTRDQLQSVVDNRPPGFGEQPNRYHSDAIFLMGIDTSRAMALFDPRPGVDELSAGDGVIYSQRLSSLRTKSRLSKIMATPEYALMTIRSWSTVLGILDALTKES